MKTRNFLIVGTLMLSLATVAYAAPAKTKKSAQKTTTTVSKTVPANVIAIVGDTKITLDQLNQRISEYPAQYKEFFTKKENKTRLLDDMINEAVLTQEATKAGVSNNNEFRNRLEQVRKQLMIQLFIQDRIDKKLTVTDDEIKKYYDDNKKQFEPSEQVRVRHILVKEEDAAKKLYQQIKNGDDFIELARKNSIDTQTAVNGGDLGWFGPGQMVAEFEKAAFALQKRDDLSEIVKTSFGYHILKLVDRTTRPEVKLDDAKEQIRQNLVNEKRQKMLNSMLEELNKQYKTSKDVSKLG